MFYSSCCSPFMQLFQAGITEFSILHWYCFFVPEVHTSTCTTNRYYLLHKVIFPKGWTQLLIQPSHLTVLQ